MDTEFQRSGLRVGDDQANDGSDPNTAMPDVETSGSDAGEGGHAAPGVQGRNAALNSSGPRVGGEAAIYCPQPPSIAQPSETPSPRSRADVARLLTRSASDGGAAEARCAAEPRTPLPRQQKSARKGGENRASRALLPIKSVLDPQNSPGNGGGEQAVRGLSSEGDTPAAKSSGREIGAGKTRNCLHPNPGESPRDNSDRKVGDGEAMLSALSKRRTPPIQISGASASGDEAITPLSSKVEAPRRNSPGRRAGADPARRVSSPNVLARDPHSSGREAGAGQAISCSTSGSSMPDLQLSGFSRGDEGHSRLDNLNTGALIAEIVQLGRARRDWMKTRVGIELRAIAICRRFCAGDKDQAKVLWKAVREGSAPEDLLFAVGPLLGPIASLEEQEKRVDRQMTKLAGKHEMAGWAKAIRGFGHAGLAKVIAECGDIGSYRGPACVWKRMGLAVINGGRQRRVPGAEALEHGYNAERRSVMWNVGGAVIGGMGKGPRPLVGEDIDAREDLTDYQKLFVRRLRLEAERDPEAHAREPVTNKETGQIKESFSAHAANRAKRYVEKRLLRDLWVAWRRAGHPRADPHWENAGSPIGSGA